MRRSFHVELQDTRPGYEYYWAPRGCFIPTITQARQSLTSSLVPPGTYRIVDARTNAVVATVVKVHGYR